MDHIVLYLDGAKRPLKEGLNIYFCQHVIKAGVISQTATFTHYFGSVIQTSSPRSTPHEVNLKIYENISEWFAQCSCKAGLGRKCKHIVAVMLFVHYNKNLEKISYTDMAQKWGSTKTERTVGLFDAKKFNELCCVKAKKFEAPPVPDDVNESNFRRLVAAAPGSSVDLHFNRKRNLTTMPISGIDKKVTSDPISIETLKELLHFHTTNMPIRPIPEMIPKLKSFYYQEIVLGLDEICRVNRKKPLWKQQKQKRINSNDAYSLYTYTKNKDPKWESKVANYMNPTLAKIKGIVDSHQLDDIAIKCYEMLYNCIVETVGYIVSPIVPWMGCTVVGLVKESKKIVEIKCPATKEYTSFNNLLKGLTYLDSKFILKEKHIFYCHIQLAMGILNADSCDFVIYSKYDDDCYVKTYLVDVNYIKGIILPLEPVYFEKILPELYKSACQLASKND